MADRFAQNCFWYTIKFKFNTSTKVPRKTYCTAEWYFFKTFLSYPVVIGSALQIFETFIYAFINDKLFEGFQVYLLFR